MHLPSRESATLSDLAAKLYGLSELLCSDLAPATQVHLAPDSDLLGELPTTQILRLREGQADYYLNGKLIMHCDSGDLLGLPRSLNLPSGEWRSSTSLVADVYERDTLVNHIHADSKRQRHWAHYLLCMQSFYE